MLWTIFVILLVLWGLGLLTGYTLGGVIHALLVIAISQAICLYRKHCQIEGPLFLGMDTHALSVPALASVLEV